MRIIKYFSVLHLRNLVLILKLIFRKIFYFIHLKSTFFEPFLIATFLCNHESQDVSNKNIFLEARFRFILKTLLQKKGFLCDK